MTTAEPRELFSFTRKGLPTTGRPLIHLGPSVWPVMCPSHGKTCDVCGDPIAVANAGKLCHRYECRRKHENEQKVLARERRYQEQLKVATAERDASCPSGDVDLSLPIVTPANTRKLTTLPRRRKYRFVKRLLKLINKGIHHDIDEVQAKVSEAAEVLPVLGDACANCRGSCCRNGGTSAFLDERVVKRFVLNHPASTARDIVNVYSRYLPDESFRGSCVFHSVTGCKLPRELRSNTCNSTVCDGFAELRNRVKLDGKGQFFLVAMESTKVVRSRFSAQ